MMPFRTEVNPAELQQKITYTDNIALFGSCFSENIGNKFTHFGFSTLTNPFGVIFNPISIANLLKRAVENKAFVKADFNVDNNRWFCFETHGDLAALTQEDCLMKHNEALATASNFLNKTNYLIITLGSAWVYEYSETNKIVANCHKVVNSKFVKRLLSKEEIVTAFRTLLKNPKFTFKIIFTVSPVRHLKDGVIENQQSKSILHLAVWQLVKEDEFSSYFPSYEIMLDDLRDYRFYKADMLHPNQQAVDYIWHKFQETVIDNSCKKLMNRINKVRVGLAHRPFNEESEEYQKFKKKIKEEITAIELELKRELG